MKRAMSGPLVPLPLATEGAGEGAGADASGDVSESGDNEDDIDAHDPGDDPEACAALCAECWVMSSVQTALSWLHQGIEKGQLSC